MDERLRFVARLLDGEKMAVVWRLSSPVMGQHNEDEKHSKRHGGYDKEIDGHQILNMLIGKRLL